MRLAQAAVLGIIAGFACPGAARAGMPSLDVADIPRLRLQSISFFLVLFLLSALLVRLLWNHLQKDFSFLPRLSYGKALALVALWGMLFVLVLTMISGARELLTPGAWEKQGWTYRLAKDSPSPADLSDVARKQKIEDLRFALWDHAKRHAGQFPADLAASGIPLERLQVADTSGMRFLYLVRSTSTREAPLAWEPDIYGPWRYVLFSNGDIRRLDTAELTRALKGEKP